MEKFTPKFAFQTMVFLSLIGLVLTGHDYWAIAMLFILFSIE